MFFGCYEAFFLRNSQRTSLSNQKSDTLRKEHWNTQNFFFLNIFEKGKSWRKFEFVLTTVFDQTSEMGVILIKTVFVPK